MRQREPLTPEQERELEALDRALAAAPVEPGLRDLEALVHDVRATAPEMRPDFAARLEHEVSAGFPVSPERPARRRIARRWVLLPAAGSLAAVIVALVVVLGGGDGERSTSSAGSARERASTAPAPGAVADAPQGAATDLAGQAPATALAPQVTARKVQRSAVLVLQAPDDAFEATTDAVIATVGRFGGIVASSQIGATDAAGGEASFDLRIPTGRVDRALAALSKLGHVTERSQALEDITGSFASARERLADARAERRGLLRALARATTQQQIDSLKARLRSVGGRIGSLEGRLVSLRRRADLSTVDLTVRSGGESGSTGGGQWTPGDAARDALRVLEVLAGVALIVLAVLLPAGLIGGPVALAVRLGRRRRREAALDPV